MNIANSIVNSDNASIRTMDTNQLLDLFNFSAEQAGTLPGLEQTSGKGTSLIVTWRLMVVGGRWS
jgi:hypothetical protein